MTLDSTDKSIPSCSYCNGMQSFPSTGDYFTFLYIKDPQHEMSHLKNKWPLSHSSRTFKQSSVVNHTILALLYNWVSKKRLRITMIRFKFHFTVLIFLFLFYIYFSRFNNIRTEILVQCNPNS